MRCSACSHAKRRELEKAIAEGVGQRVIATRFGLSFGAVGRHARNHLPKRLASALRAEVEAGVGIADRSVLDRLREVHAETWKLCERLRGKRDAEILLRAFEALRRQLETEGRILGEIDGGVSFTVNHLTAAPEWLGLRARLLDALAPFPEAALAVAGALAAAEAPGEQ